MRKAVKRIAICCSILVLVCMAVSCSGASPNSQPTEAPVGIIENNEYEYEYVWADYFAYSPYYAPIQSRCSYTLLNDGQQRLYDALLENLFYVYPKFGMFSMYKTKQVIVDGAVLSEAQVRVTLKALYDDHPYLFWLARNQMSFDYFADEERMYTAVQVYSTYPPAVIRSYLEEIAAETNAFYESVPENLTAYELEKYVHDYLIDSCVYDNTTAEPNNYAQANDPFAHSLYGAMVKKNAVCDAYARTMQFLLNGLGVDCVGITGVAKASDGDGLHMWNAVMLEDEWYFLDPTWDDQEESLLRHEYFNLNSELMHVDHEPSPLLSELSDEQINGDFTNKTLVGNIFVPECGSMEQNYFVHDCPHLTGYNGSEMEEALYQAAEKREPYFVFYVDGDYLDFDEAFRSLFDDYPQYFFVYLQNVNNRLYGYSVTSRLRVYPGERLNWIAVEMNYE